jgi:pyruvate/2-oxoglutarate dehydrogenase complex dihydrolipoamide dehydrogenase (E3) component
MSPQPTIVFPERNIRACGKTMSPEQVEVLVLGSGQGGKLLAWDMARSGRRTAVVERRWIGGSCPNIACMPSKNVV